MKLKCFVIYDDKAKAYLPPFFAPQIGQAVRSISDGINDPQSEFGKHPEDYSLFLLGEFDVLSGSFVNEEAGLLLISPFLDIRIQAQRIAEQIAMDLSRRSNHKG